MYPRAEVDPLGNAALGPRLHHATARPKVDMKNMPVTHAHLDRRRHRRWVVAGRRVGRRNRSRRRLSHRRGLLHSQRRRRQLLHRGARLRRRGRHYLCKHTAELRLLQTAATQACAANAVSAIIRSYHTALVDETQAGPHTLQNPERCAMADNRGAGGVASASVVINCRLDQSLHPQQASANASQHNGTWSSRCL